MVGRASKGKVKILTPYLNNSMGSGEEGKSNPGKQDQKGGDING